MTPKVSHGGEVPTRRKVMEIEPIGTRFGRWTLIADLGLRAGKRQRYRFCQVACDCGSIAEIAVRHLRNGDSTSCGCWHREKTAIRSREITRTHGASAGKNANGARARTPEYSSWACMIQRCCTPTTTGYKNYGGRGISVCERWRHSFENFLADMGPRPSKGHTLDRIDCDGNYEPGNCRWATWKEQATNKRRNRSAHAHRCAHGVSA